MIFARSFVFFALVFLSFGQMAQAQHLETGQVFFEYIAGGQSPTIVEANWRTITFNQPFEGRPVVIAGPLSQPNFNEQADSESLSIRIRNVTTTGFKIAVQHPNGQSGSGLDLNAYWVAVPQEIFLPLVTAPR